MTTIPIPLWSALMSETQPSVVVVGIWGSGNELLLTLQSSMLKLLLGHILFTLH